MNNRVVIVVFYQRLIVVSAVELVLENKGLGEGVQAHEVLKLQDLVFEEMEGLIAFDIVFLQVLFL